MLFSASTTFENGQKIFDKCALQIQNKKHSYSCLPFGDRRRICIVANFAIQEAVIILAMLLKTFQFSPVKGQQPAGEIKLTQNWWRSTFDNRTYHNYSLKRLIQFLNAFKRICKYPVVLIYNYGAPNIQRKNCIYNSVAADTQKR